MNEVRGYELGVVDYITKPFSIQSLKEKWKMYCGTDCYAEQETADFVYAGIPDAEPVIPEL